MADSLRTVIERTRTLVASYHVGAVARVTVRVDDLRGLCDLAEMACDTVERAVMREAQGEEGP